MGKSINYRPNNGDARILYKKSNTICTHSRTCSGSTQFYNRCGFYQMTNNLSQNNDYYIEGDKIKRDLSIETDVCILRRYYRSKRNKTYAREGSTKSKYSSVIAETDIVKEFRHGACGDSRTTTKETPQIDVAAIMVENLKGLLTNWIEKHLLENKDTKDKIEMVLHSILHKAKEEKASGISSRSTYILNKDGYNYKVKNKRVETPSLICDYCKHKSRPIAKASSSYTYKELSSQSVPSPEKNLRILSTLSIPRKINLLKLKSLYKVNKIKQKRKCSGQKSRKLLSSSSFDLLAISTRSFTKRCATYGMKRPKKRRIAFHSKPQYKNVSNSTETEEKDEQWICKDIKKVELEDMPSLMKSIYADHPANLTHADVNRTPTSDTFTLTDMHNLKRVQNLDNLNMNKVDKYTKSSFDNTLNERDQSEPMITIDFLSHSIEFPAEKDIAQNTSISRRDYGVDVSSPRNNKRFSKRRRSLKFSKLRNIQNKKYAPCHKGNKNQTINNKELLKHIQNILDYINQDGCDGNFKLNVHVSVSPIKGNYLDASTYISSTTIDDNSPIPPPKSEIMPLLCDAVKSKSCTKIILDDLSEYNPGIIALLDGAASQAKYIFNVDNSIKSEPIKSHGTGHQGNKISTSEIVREIHDLKSVVKDLLHKAEILVTEEIIKESRKRNSNPLKNNVNVRTINDLKSPIKPVSKGIQISNDFAKNLLLAGIKLSKEPKRDNVELCHRLMRKSTSYKIIESESVLKVTDMTVAEKTEQSTPNKYFSSLPKSKSLIEVESEKNKIIAYYYEHAYNENNCCKASKSVPCGKRYLPIPRFLKSKKEPLNTESSCVCSNFCSHHPVLDDCDECLSESPTSMSIDVEECCYDKKTIPTRKGMGFGEGFIYCLILWIPVTLIACLFYSYVIKDLIQANNDGSKLREGTTTASTTHKSVQAFKLSDFGF